LTLSPFTNISPLEGVTSPVKLLKVVVFPAPLTPSKAKHSPYSSPKERLSTALKFLP